MNQFHDSMDRAAQDFLKEIFGKDYEYNITDGDMDEGWLVADVVGSGDYEACNVRVDYTKMSGWTLLTHIRIECGFPDCEAYSEIDSNEDETDNFQEEVSDECGALIPEYEYGLEIDWDANQIIFEEKYGTDEEKTPDGRDWLGIINADLKTLKKIIDSYKKKTAKKTS